MGGSNEIPYNKDIDLEGNLNIYICGDINGNENECVINTIFPDYDTSLSGFIQLTKNNENYYKNGKYFYEYRKLSHSIKTIKNYKETAIYNAFIFIQKTDKNFSHILINHLYEKDIHNKKKNVIICFGSEKNIKESINELYNISKESIPFLIIINKNLYDEKLDYVSNIFDLNYIKLLIKKKYPNFNERQLFSQSKEILINYIKAKLNRINAFYNEMGYKINMFNPNIRNDHRINLTIALVGYSGVGKSTFINLMFGELVAKTCSTATDVTTKCAEYYLPKKIANKKIRFLDFPGISEERNYKLIENTIDRTYRENNEKIDFALFFIPNGIGREFTTSGKKLVNLLFYKGIKILFVINGSIEDFLMEEKIQKLRNEINNNKIFKEDLSNIINTNYYQYGLIESRVGIDNIFQKIFS